MKNKLTDLNDHLFSQLERMSVEGLSGEELANELKRSKAVVGIGKTIIDNGRLALDAERHKEEFNITNEQASNILPPMLTTKPARLDA